MRNLFKQKKNINYLMLLFVIIFYSCVTTKTDGGDTEVTDKNPYHITMDGDPSHLSQNQIDAEYYTFLFVGGETRKIYLGGKLPSIHSNYNAVWLNSSLWNPRLALSLPSENIDNNNYYYVQLAPNDVQATDNNFPIVANVGYEFGSSYTSYQTKNCTLKTTAFYSYRDWGLNVYQQSSYNSLDLTKSSILKSFSEMNVFLGTNGENIINRASNLIDENITHDYEPTVLDEDPAVIYVFQKIYPSITNTATAINTYFSEHPNEGILFFVKDYTLIHPPAPPVVPPIYFGFSFDKSYVNGINRRGPISFVYVQRIKDNVAADWEDKEIKRTTIHELGHNWCGEFTDDANHNLWHNGDNKNQCAMKFINYSSGVPTDDIGKSVLNHLGFCEGHLQRGLNISWQLKQYSPFGQSSQMLKYSPEFYVSNSVPSRVNENNLEIELVCEKKDFVQGELIDMLVKIKNLTDRTITINSPTHFLFDETKDSVIISQNGKGQIQIPPFGNYYYFINPLGYIGYNKEQSPGVPWYYWNQGNYEYYISFEVADKPVYSNKLSINIIPPPDSLNSAFADLKEDMNNIPKLNFENYQVERYETLAENYKNTFFEKEFYYKLLHNNNYFFAIQNKDEAKCLRKRALQLYKDYIIKYPNTSGTYTFFNWIYYNYTDNKDVLEEIINDLNNSIPNCWLLLVLRNQPDYMFKEIKHLVN